MQGLDEAGLLASPERPEAREPASEDLSKLRVLNAIFHESLRFFPPAAGASARQLDRELTIGGYKLPAGTAIVVPVWGLHRSRKYWGDDAKQWRPARWLEGRSVNAAKKGPAGGLRWLPFSDGPQNCIGQNIATVCPSGSSVADGCSHHLRLSADPISCGGIRMEAHKPHAVLHGEFTYEARQVHAVLHHYGPGQTVKRQNRSRSIERPCVGRDKIGGGHGRLFFPYCRGRQAQSANA